MFLMHFFGPNDFSLKTVSSHFAYQSVIQVECDSVGFILIDLLGPYSNGKS